MFLDLKFGTLIPYCLSYLWLKFRTLIRPIKFDIMFSNLLTNADNSPNTCDLGSVLPCVSNLFLIVFVPARNSSTSERIF